VEFEGARALDFARLVSFPRVAGSPGESRAAHLIERQLIAAGNSPKIEEFTILLNPWSKLKWFLLIAVVWLGGSRVLAFFSSEAAGLLMVFLFGITAFQTRLSLFLIARI
jgi:hypothetical protein